MGYTVKELALHRVKASKWLKGEAAGREREEEQGKEGQDGRGEGEGRWGEAGGAAVVKKKRKTGVGSVGWE